MAFKKGHIPWNKNKTGLQKMSKDEKEKRRKRMIKNNPMKDSKIAQQVAEKLKGKPSGMLGKTAWNKNKKMPQTANENHYRWHKDDVVKHQGIHAWLKRNFGKANKCENEKCDKTNSNFEWSELRNSDGKRKRENYWMLCRRCHRKYDHKYSKM